MKESFALLIQSIARPFYRHNAGFFMFLFLVFFGVVAPSQQLDYHYKLISGLLESPAFLGVVLLAWLLYALKCHNWVTTTLATPDFTFLNMLSRLNKPISFRLLLALHSILFIPVSGYAAAVTGVAMYKARYGIAILVQGYILLLCLATAGRSWYKLYHPGGSAYGVFFLQRFGRRPRRPIGVTPPYWSFFIRYLLYGNKALLLGIKIAGCSVLYLLLKDQTPDSYEIRMPFLMFGLVLFSHGVLIYRCRELEEKRLLFYRSLPVSLLRRFGQMAWLYFLVLIPEIMMIGWLTPAFLRWRDAVGFILSGYSLLLLLNSLLVVAPLKMSEFLKGSLVLFGILYFSILGDVLIGMAGFFFVLAGGLFRWGYGRYSS